MCQLTQNRHNGGILSAHPNNAASGPNPHLLFCLRAIERASVRWHGFGFRICRFCCNRAGERNPQTAA
jgi:hypothetical protein